MKENEAAAVVGGGITKQARKQLERRTRQVVVVDGLENAPQAFVDLFGGGSFGKQLVRVAHDIGAPIS